MWIEVLQSPSFQRNEQGFIEHVRYFRAHRLSAQFATLTPKFPGGERLPGMQEYLPAIGDIYQVLVSDGMGTDGEPVTLYCFHVGAASDSQVADTEARYTNDPSKIVQSLEEEDTFRRQEELLPFGELVGLAAANVSTFRWEWEGRNFRATSRVGQKHVTALIPVGTQFQAQKAARDRLNQLHRLNDLYLTFRLLNEPVPGGFNHSWSSYWVFESWDMVRVGPKFMRMTYNWVYDSGVLNRDIGGTGIDPARVLMPPASWVFFENPQVYVRPPYHELKVRGNQNGNVDLLSPPAFYVVAAGVSMLPANFMAWLDLPGITPP